MKKWQLEEEKRLLQNLQRERLVEENLLREDNYFSSLF